MPDSVPQGGQTEKVDEPKVPSSPDGETKQGEAPLDQSVTPESLKGKSADELVGMYAEAQRKIGEQGNELGNLRQFQRDAAVVLQAINQNPDIREKVETELLKIQGINPDEVKKEEPTAKVDAATVDTRKAVEGQIMKDFEQDYGLTNLDSEKRSQIYMAVGRELHDMLNPGGDKTIPQILDSIELTKLRGMLDKAYYLATRDQVVADAAKEGELRAKQNLSAAIGGISSSSEISKEAELNSEERDVARRLGMSEEDYKKHKAREELKT